MNKIVISNMFRAKNKQSFFAMHQIYNKIKNYDSSIDIEFHILWDSKNELSLEDDIKWKDLIESSNFNIVSYNLDFFIEYCVNLYDMNKQDTIKNFTNFKAIFLLLLPHYLRRVKMYDYYLLYDDDIVINYDFVDVINLMLEKTPVLITEPFNCNCDKVLIKKILEMYGSEAVTLYKKRNPDIHGFNAGFQGVDLSIFDDFLSKDRFELMINMFNYDGIIDSNGNEIWDHRRFVNDTQQQSFLSNMNIIKSKKDPHILDPLTCYVAPNFGSHPILGTLNSEDELNGWGCCMKSKISHFIGHTRGKGKPIQFLEKMDEYLKINNFL
jgi:hypothetical protein